MKFLFATISVVSLSALVVGCSGAPEEQATASDTASEDLSVAKKLSGSYAINGATDGTPFNTFALKSDHTFTAQGGCRQDGPGAHCFAITAFHGKWKTLTSGPQLGAPGGVSQIEFTDSLGNANTYFYSLANDQLALRSTFKGKNSMFDKDISKLPHLKSYDTCADKDNNTIGICPEDLPCEYDGPSGNIQRCLPPI